MKFKFVNVERIENGWIVRASSGKTPKRLDPAKVCKTNEEVAAAVLEFCGIDP